MVEVMSNDTLVRVEVPSYQTAQGLFYKGDVCTVPHARALTLQAQKKVTILEAPAETPKKEEKLEAPKKEAKKESKPESKLSKVKKAMKKAVKKKAKG